MRIAICVGEVSGDMLGAQVIHAIKEREPNAEFFGIAGPLMKAAGCEVTAPMDKLAVMGIGDVLKKLPTLYKFRQEMFETIVQQKPDVFIGIDAPDFNLGLEKKLKAAGIKTAHYVSPSVWAWRKGRLKTIKKALDKVFCLFPFESRFYKENKVAASFVGHPMADEIHANPIRSEQAKQQLGYVENEYVVAVLPGSRHMEVEQLMPVFLDTIEWMHARKPHIQFVIPAASEQRKKEIERQVQQRDDRLPVKVILENARLAMSAADVVLVTSGTATLEAMLLNKPMVVAYKMTSFNWFFIRKMVKLSHFALPNLLANEAIVPEFLQDEVTVPNLGHAVFDWIQNYRKRDQLFEQYKNLQQSLAQNANQQVAEQLLALAAA